MAQSAEAKEGTQPLARTPLFELCAESKARMTAFAGWEMPVQYSGIAQEHQAVRGDGGMFDISHMGKFALKGKNLISALQYLVPSDLSQLQAGEAKYSVLLNDRSGILDDIIFYYQGCDEAGEHRGMTIVNAAMKSSDKAWLLAHLQNAEVELEDLSEQKVLIAVQGPKAESYLQKFVEADLAGTKLFGHLQAPVCGESGFIARTGYTGEDGFEVMVPPSAGVKLWRGLLEAGIAPCGLGCRDTLRLEAAMALYGNDIDESTTPLEAGLGWLVDLNAKGDFIGRKILEEQKQNGLERKLVGIEMEGRHIARHGYPVLSEGKPVGEITSGSWSPTLAKAIALAYLPIALAKKGRQIEVEIRGKACPGVVVKKPFYRSPHKKKKF